MNHYLLPESTNHDAVTARYGNIAIKELLREMQKLGAQHQNLRAKIYGGGNVVSSLVAIESVGAKNISFAKKILNELKIPIVEENLGGDHGRRITLNSLTGAVVHRFNASEAEVEQSDKNNNSSPKNNLSKSKSHENSVSVKSLPERQVQDLSGRPQWQIKKNIRVLIVDDSAAIKNQFSKVFEKAGFTVVGTASDPFEAREILIREKPDVMTLDIEMPKMNGVQFLEKVMKHLPVPTVMVSSLSADGEAAAKCLELGAIEFIHKISQHNVHDIQQMAESLVEKVRSAASMRVSKISTSVEGEIPPQEVVSRSQSVALKVIVVGGNTGSAESIETLATTLQMDTPPVIIACSTVATFLPAFVKKIKAKSRLGIHIATSSNLLTIGNIYFIPHGHHGRVENINGRYALTIVAGPAQNRQLPSADVLFESAAQNAGKEALGILLGGFGLDGVKGLGSLQNKGAVTIVQIPEETSFPFAPQTAISEGFSDNILSVKNMAHFLLDRRSKAVV